MTILDTIVEHKRIEILQRKRKFNVSDLTGFPLFNAPIVRIRREAFMDRPGIIAEFKRRSPSKGMINSEADPVSVAKAYFEAGVAAMSILTDRDFFGGSFRDLKAVRESNPDICLLRKDFIIDPYQLYEAKAYGASIILLIAAILSKEQIRDLAVLAGELNLQVLLEVHNPQELDKFADGIELVGVNNRDLRDFSVDINQSLELIGHFPDNVIPVSESGINDQNDIRKLNRKGFKLFLIGESFMKEKNPGRACKIFIRSLES